MTLQAAYEEWYSEASARRQWSHRTTRIYEDNWERLAFLHGRSIKRLQQRDIEETIGTLLRKGYSPGTVNITLSVLYAVLDYSVRRQIIPTNPAKRSPRPLPSKRMWRILTPDEIRLVDSKFVDEKARMIFQTLTRTGIRRHELRNLRVEDVDLDAGRLSVRQSKTTQGVRVISLSGGLTERLRGYLLESNTRSYVFPSGTGNKLDERWYTDRFRVALARAGITDYVRPFHDLRHTSLTNEAATGVSNPLALMARAGHRSMNTTQQYLQLAGICFPEQAEALDKLLS